MDGQIRRLWISQLSCSTTHVAPGCVAYAAPECQTPALQGPKMDVYSFGVLLFEVYTGRMPDPGQVEPLRKRVPFGAKPPIASLAKNCTCAGMQDRPTMAEIFKTLKDI